MPTHKTENHLVTALLENMWEARASVDELRAQGIPEAQIALFASRKHYSEKSYRELDQRFYANGKRRIGHFLAGLSSVTLSDSDSVLAVGGSIVSELVAENPPAKFAGFLASRGVPEEIANLYYVGLEYGHMLVVVQSSPESAWGVSKQLEYHNPINLEQRKDLWELLLTAPG